MKGLLSALFLSLVATIVTSANAVMLTTDQLTCIAPARPGGGHDITCQLLVKTLMESLLVDEPMNIRYMPGDIGALAYNYNISQNDQDPHMVTAASTGSALNIALQKFGGYGVGDVRWLGALAADFGIVAVRSDSPFTSLDDLTRTVAADVKSLVVGGAGSVGSQDWMKAALVFDSKGIDPMQVRYISYEGGGDALQALLRGHIQVFPGDLTEAAPFVTSGEVRIIAVLAEERLARNYGFIPTAREQGYDVVWPVWRGYYTAPNISEQEYQWWINTFYRLIATEEFKAERNALRLFPFSLIGEEFDIYVKKNVYQMREIAEKFDLVR